MTNSGQISARCNGCGHCLPVTHSGPCPDCGLEDKEILASVGQAVEISQALPVSWQKTREYYEKAPLLVAGWITFAIASSVIGLIAAGWYGVLISLGLSAIGTIFSFRGLVKVREIERGGRKS